MERREFLKGTVFAGTAGLLLDACAPGSEKAIPILIPEGEFIPGAEEWLATTCFECPGGCGLLARKIDGRLVKVEGNPLHPISRGGSCARAQALPQALYHPDRLRSPLAREGERGAGGWREISWEDAIARLASALGKMQEEGSTRSLAFLTGAVGGHRRALVRRFLDAFGSPYRLVHESFGDQAVLAAQRLSTGIESFFAWDLENTNYLISFGAALLEASRSPVRFARGFGHMRQGRAGRRAKMVAVEPRLSLTAARADEWVPARPGSDAAVALGLAHLLVRDGLFDARFVKEKTGRFEAFRDGVLPRFSPERVAAAAGIRAEVLERLAREMAGHRPALAITGDAAASGPAGLATALAVSHLNALLGSFGVPGGIYFDPAPPFSPWPSLPRDPRAERDRASYREFQSLAALVPYLVRGELAFQALLVAGSNPLHSLPSSLKLRQALSRIPFIASFSSFLDETSEMADLVLPEPTPFERWEDDVPSPGVGIPAASLSAPLFEKPLYDTRSMPDLLLEVASRLGGNLSAAFPWKTYAQALRSAWAGIQKAGRGSIIEPSESAFWEKAVKQGGWWDESASRRADFMTPEGRYLFEIEPFEVLPLRPSPGPEEFPLFLHVYPSSAFGDGKSAHLPFLQELADPMTGARWGTVVELNPQTAAASEVAEGDLVEVASPRGKIRAPAHLTPGIRPEVVAVAAGQGHTGYGRFARGRGANVFELLAPEIDPASEQIVLSGTRVRIDRV